MHGYIVAVWNMILLCYCMLSCRPVYGIFRVKLVPSKQLEGYITSQFLYFLWLWSLFLSHCSIPDTVVTFDREIYIQGRLDDTALILATFNFCQSLQLRSSGRRRLIKRQSDLRKRLLMGCPLHLLLIELDLAVESPVQCATYSSAEFLCLLATQSLKIHFHNFFSWFVFHSH